MTSTVAMAAYLEGLLNTNKVSLGLQDVFYGDQARIPRTPVACVETGDKSVELNGAPRRVMATMTNYVIIYHASVASPQGNRRDNDALAETIETLINSDAQMASSVIDSLVRAVEYGYAERTNTIYRTSRLTIEARQQEQLPSSF